MVTLFPLSIGTLKETYPNWSFVNLKPLETILRYWHHAQRNHTPLWQATLFVKNVAGNILMFVPLGVLLPVLFKPMRRLWLLFIVGLGVSVFVEGFQFVEMMGGLVFYRAVDIDDVILNALGAVLGWCAWRLCFHLFRKKAAPFGA